MKIYDCFLFFNELDLLEIRLETLWDVVDFFVLTESTMTFSGKFKPLYFQENKNKFKKYSSKIIYNIIDDTPFYADDFLKKIDESSGYKKDSLDRAYRHPNLPHNQPQWLREFYQREMMVKPLLQFDPSLIMISDLDEIPHPDGVVEALSKIKDNPYIRFVQDMYQYYLNVKKNEKWFGPGMTYLENILKEGTNYLRNKKDDTLNIDSGWHFTYLGGAEKIREKIGAYSHQEFNNSYVFQNIEANIRENKDIFNRSGESYTTVDIDETYPKYVIDNLDKFKDYIK